MTGPSDIPDETLMAFADGELAGPEAEAVARQVAADPALAAKVEAHRALRARLAAAFEPTLEEPVPEHLLALVQGGAAPLSAKPAEVVDLAAARARRQVAAPAAPGVPRWMQLGALAACLAVGVFIGRAALPPGGDAVSRGGVLVAQGDLARALDVQLASNPGKAPPVRIGLTFKDTAGHYCRTFQPGKGRGLAGVACRDGGDWRLAMTAEAQAPAGDYQMAASATPAAVLDTAQAMMAGEPLDAAAESNARAKGWR